MQLRVTTEWSENSQNPRQYFLQMILSEKLFLWVLRRSQRSGQCLFGTGDLHTHSSQFSSRTGLQPDGCWGRCPQTPEVYPLLEYPVKMKKSSYISATAFIHFYSFIISISCAISVSVIFVLCIISCFFTNSSAQYNPMPRFSPFVFT